jgi:phosphoribosyl-ATP pyrophosphohydrolase
MNDALRELARTIEDRKRRAPTESYTASLFSAGQDEILKKVGEEAVEVILAAKAQTDERVIAEVADLLYHLLVLLSDRGLALEQVEAELVKRRR